MKIYGKILRFPKLNINFTNGYCVSNNLETENIKFENFINETDNLKLKENLFNSIFNGIVLETKDFYLIDKPVGISLHRNKPLTNLKYNGVNSMVTVSDILPELESKLKLPENSVHISSELPWAFSGLFVLSKSKSHFEICKSFYKNSSYGQIPGYINQAYRCLCWNLPRKSELPVKGFTYASYKPDEADFSTTITYKCEKLSKRNLNQRKFWTKFIGHDLISVGNKQNDNTALIDVKCNSTYRGLVQLYLLHQGCIVLGEFIQASRLISGGINNDICILPPEKANGAKMLPPQLRQRLGVFSRNIKELPLHIHCHQLLVPSLKITKKNISYLEKSSFDFNSKSSSLINWDNKLKLNVCSYDKLPNHYLDTMKQLDINLPLSDQI